MNEILFGSTRVSVRPYAEEDLPEALLVYRQCEDFLALGPVPTASSEMVLEDVRHSRDEEGIYCMIRAAGGEDRAQGCARAAGVLDFVPRCREPGTAFLSLLMIAAPFRGRGIGSETVSLLEAHLKEVHGIRVAESGVQTNNAAGIRFWTARGYRIVSGPTLLPDTTVAYGLRKEL